MTVSEVAKRLGRARNSITQALVKLGKQKVGGIYLIDQDTYAQLEASKGAGRPKGLKNKPKE